MGVIRRSTQRRLRRLRDGDHRGTVDEATRAVEKAERRHDRRAVAEALFSRALAWAMLGEVDRTIEDASRALDEGDPTPGARVVLHGLRGASLLDRGDRTGARDDLDRMVAELDPFDRNAVAMAAGIECSLLLMERRWPEAWTAADRAVSEAPDSAEDLVRRATVAGLMGRVEEAEQDLELAIALGPPRDAVRALAERASLRLRNGDVAGAAEAVVAAQGLEVDPTSTPRMTWAGGLVALARGDLAAAGAEAEALVALAATPGPDRHLIRAWGHAVRAEVRARTGDGDGALADADVVLGTIERTTDDPTGAHACRTRARVHLERDDLAAAEADVARAMHLDRDAHDPSAAAANAALAAAVATPRSAGDH